jgi:hypothetical protein
MLGFGGCIEEPCITGLCGSICGMWLLLLSHGGGFSNGEKVIYKCLVGGTGGYLAKPDNSRGW